MNSENLVDDIAQAVRQVSAPTHGVNINVSEFVVPVSVLTGEKDSEEVFTTYYHKFAPQKYDDVLNLLNTAAVERAKTVGGRTQVEYGSGEALRRYWAKHHLGVKGYPGAEDWRVVGEDDRANWHPAHQSLAVNSLLRCEAKIVASHLTFDGGVWTVDVAVPTFKSPAFVLRYNVNEWGERQATAIERKGLQFFRDGRENETHINAGLYVSTFNELVRDVSGCHCDGADWQQFVTDGVTRERFLKTIYPAWTYKAAEVLFTRWQVQKQD